MFDQKTVGKKRSSTLSGDDRNMQWLVVKRIKITSRDSRKRKNELMTPRKCCNIWQLSRTNSEAGIKTKRKRWERGIWLKNQIPWSIKSSVIVVLLRFNRGSLLVLKGWWSQCISQFFSLVNTKMPTKAHLIFWKYR